MVTRFALVVSALVLLIGACGEGSPSSSPTDSIGDLVDGEPFSVSATDKAYYQSLEEMYKASEIVIVGEVVDFEPGEFVEPPGVHPDESGFLQMGVITVRVDEILRGKLDGDTVTVERESFMNEDDELRPLIFEGFGAERVGNDVLWFLEQRPGRPDEVYEMVSFDGLLYIEDGVITTPRAGGDTLAHETSGRTAGDVIAELRALATETQP